MAILTWLKSWMQPEVPYKDVAREKVILPKRQKPGGYRDPEYPHRRVPEKF